MNANDIENFTRQFTDNFNEKCRQYDELERRHNELRAELEAAMGENRRLREALKQQKKEVEDALQYRERYYATSLTVEHLKGRLETARNGVIEKEEEHQAEKNQLRAQMNDLLARIDTETKDTQLKTLKDRIVELEEKCAVLSGHTIEEKERLMQQQMISSNAVQDLQSRITAAEQRARNAEKEVAQLKNMVRRATDAQNESKAISDRLELEKQRLLAQIATRASEYEALQRRMGELERASELRVAEITRSAEAAQRALKLELAAQREAADRRSADAEAEADRLQQLRQTIQRRVSAAREESAREIEAIQRAKADALSEVQRLRGRLAVKEQEEAEARSVAAKAEERVQSIERRREDLARQLESATQREAWLVSERDQLTQALQLCQARLGEADEGLKAREGLHLEAERMKIQLAYMESERTDAQEQVKRLTLRCKQIEEGYEKKLKFMYKQLKSEQKAHRDVTHQNDAMRRKLTTATLMQHTSPLTANQIMAAPAALPSKGYGEAANTSGLSDVRVHVADGNVPRHHIPLSCDGVADAGTMDVLSVLRAQSVTAAALQTQIASLTKS